MSRLRAILLVAGGVLFVAAAFAAGRSILPGAQAHDGPALRIEQTHWDLGEVAGGSVLQTRLAITNAGSRRLVINEEVCALCDAQPLPTTIVAPGESTRIELPWDTSGVTGPLELMRRFTTNDPRRPTFDVTIAATALARPGDD